MDSKKWYQSKGVWGGLISFISVIVMMFGVNILPNEQTQIVNNLTSIITQISALVGSILAIYGRIKANKKIGK